MRGVFHECRLHEGIDVGIEEKCLWQFGTDRVVCPFILNCRLLVVLVAESQPCWLDLVGWYVDRYWTSCVCVPLIWVKLDGFGNRKFLKDRFPTAAVPGLLVSSSELYKHSCVCFKLIDSRLGQPWRTAPSRDTAQSLHWLTGPSRHFHTAQSRPWRTVLSQLYPIHRSRLWHTARCQHLHTAPSQQCRTDQSRRSRTARSQQLLMAQFQLFPMAQFQL